MLVYDVTVETPYSRFSLLRHLATPVVVPYRHELYSDWLEDYRGRSRLLIGDSDWGCTRKERKEGREK